jgi:cbb3-type cytochrome oxidase maturation protein
MSVILLMLPATLLLALIFLIAYIWSIRSGQYEDVRTPSMRMLADDVGDAPGGARLEPKPGTKDS